MIDVRVQSADFDPGRQLERLRGLGRGAVASHLCIAEVADDVTSILVEHYAAMAKGELGRIAEEAQARWPLSGIIVIHRHGSFVPGDRILFVGAASSDHQAALEACAYLARSVGERAPFWRKEQLAGGGSRWMERLPSAERQPA